jgi:hypothetical protein
MQKIIATAAMLILLAVPAAAGSTTLKKGNSKMALYCNGSGCYTALYVNGKKGKPKRIGAGGSDNYTKHKKAFQAQGWT